MKGVNIELIRYDLGVRKMSKKDEYFKTEDVQVYQWGFKGTVFGVPVWLEVPSYELKEDRNEWQYYPSSYFNFKFDPKNHKDVLGSINYGEDRELFITHSEGEIIDINRVNEIVYREYKKALDKYYKEEMKYSWREKEGIICKLPTECLLPKEHGVFKYEFPKEFEYKVRVKNDTYRNNDIDIVLMGKIWGQEFWISKRETRIEFSAMENNKWRFCKDTDFHIAKLFEENIAIMLDVEKIKDHLRYYYKQCMKEYYEEFGSISCPMRTPEDWEEIYWEEEARHADSMYKWHMGIRDSDDCSCRGGGCPSCEPNRFI